MSLGAAAGTLAPRLGLDLQGGVLTLLAGQSAAGSVIVDLAVESGGNCELSEPGAVVERHGVTTFPEQDRFPVLHVLTMREPRGREHDEEPCDRTCGNVLK